MESTCSTHDQFKTTVLPVGTRPHRRETDRTFPSPTPTECCRRKTAWKKGFEVMQGSWRTTRSLFFLVSLILSVEGTSGNWAVLIAGSRYFWNYRHQADVCHAYHLMRRNGIPEDQVILMSYNDAADSADNPVRGTLYNKPTPEGVAGYDVNRGCKPSYTGSEVNSMNFLAVLKGDNSTTQGKPVLRSTREDRVFIYFADHGAVGLIAMPVGEPLYAKDLVDSLTYMWDNQMYKELVFYMEACESGSMFDGLLPTDINMYATTAANPDESSYGTYCGSDSVVDGTMIGSCLGDLYSVNFLENSDIPALFHSESLDGQFELIKNETDLSHVQKYGTKLMGVDPIEWFLGAINFPSLALGDHGEVDEADEGLGGRQAAAVAALDAPKNGVDSRDIALHTLRHKLLFATSQQEHDRFQAEIAAELAARDRADDVFNRILLETSRGEAVPPLYGALVDHACLKASSSAVISRCGAWNDYSLKYVRVLAELCDAGYDVDRITVAVNTVCATEAQPQPQDQAVW